MRADWLTKKLIFMLGKGGVGKSTLAEAAARALAAQGQRVLLIHALQLEDQPQELALLAPNLWTITLRAGDCFREYIVMKLKIKALYTAFLGNRITQYLEKAAPGVKEMVLLGKIWFERQNYDHVIVDMPSTGYALTMLHTPFNFAELFPGGPIYHDSKHMIETFSDPAQSAFVIVSLAEEMPLQESVELETELEKLLPRNPAFLVINRLTRLSSEAHALLINKKQTLRPDERSSPLWQGLEYLAFRENNQQALLAEFKSQRPALRSTWLELEEAAASDETERSLILADQLGKDSHAC